MNTHIYKVCFDKVETKQTWNMKMKLKGDFERFTMRYNGSDTQIWLARTNTPEHANQCLQDQ